MRSQKTTTRRRKLFRRLLIAFNIVVVVPGILLLSAEIWIRYDLAAIEERNSLIEASMRRSAEVQELTSASMWDEAHRRYRPNSRIDVVIDGERLVASTNSDGYRGAEIEIPKPKDVFRIVCLGASTTVEGPTNDSTYPALLERKLRERFSKHRIEVINGGISGNFSNDELERLPEIFELQPDLIIEYNVVNDLCWRVLPKIYAAASFWQRTARNTRLVAIKWESLIQPSRLVIERTLNETTLSSLRAIHKSCKEHNVQFALCSFCYPEPNHLTEQQREYFNFDLRTNWGVPWTSFEEYVRMVKIYNKLALEFCNESGAVYLPIVEATDCSPDNFTDICHMTPRGIESKADAVFLSLVETVQSGIKRTNLP